MGITIHCEKCQFNKDNPTFEYCYEHCWNSKNHPLPAWEQDQEDVPILVDIKPRKDWEYDRKLELLDAINQYAKRGVPVPPEWTQEVLELELRTF